MKVTKKIQHDKMWVRVAEGKEHVRLYVSRNGWRIAGCGTSMRKITIKMKDIFEECLSKGMTFGDSIEYVYLEFS